MMVAAARVFPTPVSTASTPSSFIRRSWYPCGKGSTRSSFLRSTHSCSSPGRSPVSAPISNIVTTTTLTGTGGSAALAGAWATRLAIRTADAARCRGGMGVS